ncbi:N-acylneuraminate-9-phosphate synthase [Candidatus Falkowbacteria bacterium CG10_big_fil_rev_8_21_14_0_10_43_10]|uniref:N-acylneuraminate-9-phosphate synthase n=1 Tax=Candidatus Falkowbacteria bacterium CG10_big_fil_rev_8_21_14_0_10_43_10 TaxID=1974567 RepID=A0A2H0V231_9BACT|nr:MAG: N-acylneuraminate-9-phosphate synthase [Candidatus Falkowbacteria bacterium CG10_big_fil_rev_8_21_14_0_10_43_10]
MPKKVNLNGRLVGDGEPVYIIAEGGLTNWGDLNLAKKQVDAAMAAGCDAVKFQANTTEELISKKVSPYWYRRVKYKELPHSQLRELWDYCQIRNIQCFITAHVDVDLDFIDKELNVPFFKIGSGESMNYEFLRNVGSRGKPVIMSLGLHLTDEEILKSVRTLEEVGCKDIIVCHCNTIYPTPPEINDLGMITRLKKLLDYPIGYSDHTVGRHITIAAVAMGACLIEKHISFDKNDKRSLDCPGSCLPEEEKLLVKEAREVEAAMISNSSERLEKIKEARKWAQQSIVARRDIKSGEVITREMIAYKRPGKGLSPEKAGVVIGRTARKDIPEDELILEVDVF